MERLAATADGRVEVSGRWFGVRGRRFVRPALTLTPTDGGPPRRWLADLEHKPWAAEDGEPWIAAFPADLGLDDASAIELSVAPDIAIVLRAPEGATGAAAAGPVAAQSRSPLAKQDPHGRRPSARAQDMERLTTRLSAAQAALERERERRAGVDQALEEQRAESRRLSAELGRARAELDLAQTVRREAEAMSAELDSTRRQLSAAERRYAELVAEHDRTTKVQARVETELRERTGALESARDALAQERARTAERVRGAEARRAALPAAGTAPAPPGIGYDDSGRPPIPRPDVRARPGAPNRVERPVNPARGSRPNWGGRVLALLVIIAVVVALWLVLHSTILH